MGRGSSTPGAHYDPFAITFATDKIPSPIQDRGITQQSQLVHTARLEQAQVQSTGEWLFIWSSFREIELCRL